MPPSSKLQFPFPLFLNWAPFAIQTFTSLLASNNTICYYQLESRLPHSPVQIKHKPATSAQSFLEPPNLCFSIFNFPRGGSAKILFPDHPFSKGSFCQNFLWHQLVPKERFCQNFLWHPSIPKGRFCQNFLWTSSFPLLTYLHTHIEQIQILQGKEEYFVFCPWW